DLGGARLPRRWPRARAAQGHRPGDLRVGHRRRGHGRVRAALAQRGDHPGDRVRPRGGRGAAPRPRTRARGRHPREPLRTGRQGRGHRGEVVQAVSTTGGRQLAEQAGRASTEIFEKARAEGRAALVGYLPAGYPTVDGSVEMLSALVEGGCDLLEVGVPYSDPVMDGPTIQAAADIALRGGVRLRDVFRVVERVSAAGGRAVVMTYFNPVLRYGVDAFARDLAAAGGLGVITPDLIPDEAG